MLTIRIESFTKDKPALLKDAFRIRHKVFIEEQGVDKFLEYDGLDDESVHYLVYYDDKPVCTARWRETSEGVKLERFATLKKFRGKSLASVLLRYILEELTLSKKKLYMYAQVSAVSFYEAHNFEKKGEKFVEADLEHYMMEYKY